MSIFSKIGKPFANCAKVLKEKFDPYKNRLLIKSVQKNLLAVYLTLLVKNCRINRLCELNLDRLDLRRLHSDLILTFKLLYGHLDIDPNSLFSFHPQVYHDFRELRLADTVLRLQKTTVLKAKDSCRSDEVRQNIAY